MPIDPNIALGVRPAAIQIPQVETPIDRYAKVMNLRELMQQGQMRDVQMQEAQMNLAQAQRVNQQRQALGEYFGGMHLPAADGTPATGEPDYQHMMRIAPDVAPAIIKQFTDMRKGQLENQVKEQEVQQNNIKRLAGLAQGISDEPTKTAAIATAFGEKRITPEQRDQLLQLPYNDPTWKSWISEALTADQALTQSIKDAQEKRDQLIFKHTQAMMPAQEAEAQSKATKAGLDTAQTQRSQDAMTLAAALRQGPQAVADAMKDWAPERRAPFAGAKTETDLLRAAMTPAEVVTGAETALRDKQSHEIALAHLNIARKADQRAEQVYQNTYGPNANQALVGVDPKLRVQATSAAQKAADAFSKANAAQEDIKAFLDLAKQGNKEAYAYMSPEGVLTLNTGRGVSRVNMPEIETYAQAGSLIDQLKGKIGKITTGASISKDVLKDIGDLHERIHQNAVKTYNNQLDTVNQNYHSNFQPIKSATGGGSQSAPAGGGGHIIEINGKHYQYKGAGATDDLGNYTEVK